jgi:hypothetical protein
MIDINRLSYIKNVNDDNGWVYKDYPVGSYFLLHFSRGDDGADTHALRLPKGAHIILSQRPPQNDRYLTHVVELVNDGSEDETQWISDQFGIVRWVKVNWVANFNSLSSIPIDKDVMKANWGYQGTKAKSLESPNLMSQWGDIDRLRTHLESVFN